MYYLIFGIIYFFVLASFAIIKDEIEVNKRKKLYGVKLDITRF